MIKRLTLYFILFVISICHSQGSITVNSTVDRDRILIGDVITYSVIIERDADVDVVMPSLAQNLGMFEIRAYNVLEPQKKNGKTIEQTDYSISTFDTGDYVIPELEINYRLQGDSTWQVIKTEPIDIFVESLNPDEAGDIRDIKPPMTPPRDYTMIFWMIVFGLLIIAAVIFAIYYIKRIREGKSIIPRRSTPPRPAHEIAFEQLIALKKADLIAQNRIKDFYTEVSDTLRRYIQNRYFIPAMEKTTTELLDDMTTNGLADEHKEIVRGVLTQSDFVKFAKFIPPAEQHESTWQTAYNFVDATKLIFDPTEESESPDNDEGGIIVESATNDEQDRAIDEVIDENEAAEVESVEKEGKADV